MSGRLSPGSRGACSLAFGALLAASAMISGCWELPPSGKHEMYDSVVKDEIKKYREQ